MRVYPTTHPGSQAQHLSAHPEHQQYGRRDQRHHLGDDGAGRVECLAAVSRYRSAADKQLSGKFWDEQGDDEQVGNFIFSFCSHTTCTRRCYFVHASSFV